MNQDQRKRRALISVSDKTNVITLAEALVNQGFTIVSTGGTAKHLQAAGIAVTQVSDVTGFPEILDGRVKTLHPKILGGILARNTPEHQQTLREHGIEPFDIVCVNLYPFEQTVAREGCTLQDAIENIDIGGPNMLRAAAKNYQSGVTVICDPSDYEQVISELDHNGSVSEALRAELAAKAFEHTAHYDAAIYRYFAQQVGTEVASAVLKLVRELAYGENKSQSPASLWTASTGDPLALDQFQVAAGDPSYVGMADLDSCLEVLCRLAETFRLHAGSVPYIAIACKHGDPCGAAIDWDNPLVATEKMLFGDPVAVMGGEVITNFPITDKLAQQLHVAPADRIGRDRWGLDMVAAPDFSDAAITILEGRTVKPRRLLRNPHLLNPMPAKDEWRWRPVRGGALRQKSPTYIFSPCGDSTPKINMCSASQPSFFPKKLAMRKARHFLPKRTLPP